MIIRVAVRACERACVSVRACVCLYVRACVRACARVQVCVYVHSLVRVFCTLVNVYACTRECLFAYTHMCMKCMYM